MQPQPDLFHPAPDRFHHFHGLALAGAMHDRVIHVTFESHARKFPGHPHIERIVEEQIRQHGRNRRSLRSSTVPPLQSSVGQLERRTQPPLHIKHDPTLAGVGLHRLDNEVPGNAVEELLDVEIDDPVGPETTLPAFPPPRPGQTAPAGTRRSPGGTSVPPPSPAGPRPRSARSCPRRWEHRESGCLRHAVSVFPPPAPGAGNSCPRTSGSRSYTDCSADPSRTPLPSSHPLPARPYWP